MTIKDLLKMEIDIDAVDQYTEECYIAFCGPIQLTEEGRRVFEPILDNKVEFKLNTELGNLALLECENDQDLELLQALFYGAAGYIGASTYDQLFKS